MKAAEGGRDCRLRQELGRGWEGTGGGRGAAGEGPRRSWEQNPAGQGAPRPGAVCDRGGGNAGNGRKRGPRGRGKETPGGRPGAGEGGGSAVPGAGGTPPPPPPGIESRHGARRGRTWSARPGRAGLGSPGMPPLAWCFPWGHGPSAREGAPAPGTAPRCPGRDAAPGLPPARQARPGGAPQRAAVIPSQRPSGIPSQHRGAAPEQTAPARQSTRPPTRKAVSRRGFSQSRVGTAPFLPVHTGMLR